MTNEVLPILVGASFVDLNTEKFEVSLFNSSKDNSPKRLHGTIGEIFPPHVTRNFSSDKKDGIAISTALYLPEATRANKNVKRLCNLFVLDLDKITLEEFREICFKTCEFAVLFYTTSSHTGKEGECKYRMVIVASRQMSVQEQQTVLRRLDYILGSKNDEACFDSSRIFFRAMSSEKNKEFREYSYHNGLSLDVDYLLNLPSENFPTKSKKSKNKKDLGRNSQLTSIAGKMRSGGADYDEILLKLKQVNEVLFLKNPLDAEEVESIARSISRYEVNDETVSTQASENGGRTNLELARNLIRRFSIINTSERVYWYTGLRYDELTKGELSSLILRTLDSDGIATGLEKKDFDEICFFVRGLSIKEQKVVCGKPLGNPNDSADYINLQNGILKINRENWGLELITHSDKYFNLEILPYSYDPEATAPIWIDFLNKVLPSPDVQALLGEWIGLNLIFDTSFARFMMFIGEGANGKSVVILIMMLLLGRDAFCSVGLDSMTPDNRFGLAPLIDMKANIVGDMNMTAKFSEGLFKEMVSGGIFTADRKHQPATKVTATARHTFAMNDFPLIRDRSEGVFRRAIAILFAVTVAKPEQNRKLITEKFWLESGELPGVFNWALIHLKNLISRGDFLIPLECEKVVSDLKESLQPEVEFMKDVVIKESTSLIPVGELYFKYKVWAGENGYYQMSQSAFGKELQRRFKVIKTPNAIKCSHEDSIKARDRHWVGLTWKKQCTDDR